jgi:hypothetical protein
MRPNPAAADTIRTLIAAVPDERLRELFLELALAALAVLPSKRKSRLRATDDDVVAGAKACVGARASTRSIATAVPISMSSTPNVGRSATSRAKHGPARPNAAAASRRTTAPGAQWHASLDNSPTVT